MAKEAIEVAPSGRGKCGHCKQPIGQGALRFGFKLDGSIAWFHLSPCATAVYPEKVERELQFTKAKVPDRTQLAAEIEAARPAARRERILPVDRAPSGRAACKHCKKLVAKGTLRANFQNYGDTTGTSSLHVACVGAFIRGDAASILTADKAETPALAALLAALAHLERDAKAQKLARAAVKDAASLDVLADFLEERGAAVAKDELSATLAIFTAPS